MHPSEKACRMRDAFRMIALLAFPCAVFAQTVVALDAPPIRHALDAIKSTNTWTLDQQVSICEIPAPGFAEQVRGAEFRKRLIALGYPNTRIDSIGNVIAERPGTGRGPTVMIAGHLD